MSVKIVVESINGIVSVYNDDIQPHAASAAEVGRGIRNVAESPDAKRAERVIRELFAGLLIDLGQARAPALHDRCESVMLSYDKLTRGSSTADASRNPATNPSEAVASQSAQLMAVATNTKESIEQAKALVLATLSTVLGGIAANGALMADAADGVNMYSQYAAQAAGEYAATLQGGTAA